MSYRVISIGGGVNTSAQPRSPDGVDRNFRRIHIPAAGAPAPQASVRQMSPVAQHRPVTIVQPQQQPAAYIVQQSQPVQQQFVQQQHSSVRAAPAWPQQQQAPPQSQNRRAHTPRQTTQVQAMPESTFHVPGVGGHGPSILAEERERAAFLQMPTAQPPRFTTPTTSSISSRKVVEMAQLESPPRHESPDRNGDQDRAYGYGSYYSSNYRPSTYQSYYGGGGNSYYKNNHSSYNKPATSYYNNYTKPSYTSSYNKPSTSTYYQNYVTSHSSHSPPSKYSSNYNHSPATSYSPPSSPPQQPVVPVPTHHATTTYPATGGSSSAGGGRMKSLFVGINYPGTKAELAGCVNDVTVMLKLLPDRLNFDVSNRRVLVDADLARYRDRAGPPTKANIINGLKWLADGARPGDSLFWHYSGHGTSVKDKSGDEKDGLDEALVPADYERAGMITDDEVYEVFLKHLPAGVRVTAINDCCHSGTIMDLEYGFVWTGERFGDPPKRRTRDFVQDSIKHCNADVLLLSGCKDAQTSADTHSTKFLNPYDGPGFAGGACTNGLTEMLTEYDNVTYGQLLTGLWRILKAKRYEQVPQLSCSAKIDMFKKFSLMGSFR